MFDEIRAMQFTKMVKIIQQWGWIFGQWIRRNGQ